MKHLVSQLIPQIENLTKDDLVTSFELILDPQIPSHQLHFLVGTLSKNLDDPKLSDLIFWPNVYFDEKDNYDGHELTAAEMAEIALARSRPETTGNIVVARSRTSRR